MALRSIPTVTSMRPTSMLFTSTAPDGTRSTFVASLPGVSDLEFGPDGTLYAGVQIANQSIVKISTTGDVTPFVSGLAGAPVGLAIDASGNVFASLQNQGQIIKVSPGGVATLFANLSYRGLAFDSSGLLYAAAQGGIYRFTPDGTRSTFYPNNTASFTFVAFQVPEPSTFGLLALGMIVLSASRGILRARRDSERISTHPPPGPRTPSGLDSRGSFADSPAPRVLWLVLSLGLLAA